MNKFGYHPAPGRSPGAWPNTRATATDFVGFRPNLPDNTLAFSPAVPSAWKSFHAILQFGADEQVHVDFSHLHGGERWVFRLQGGAPRKVSFSIGHADKSRASVAFELEPGKPASLSIRAGKARIDGKVLAAAPQQASYAAAIGKLRFQTPKAYRPGDFPMFESKDVLKGIIERDEYR